MRQKIKPGWVRGLVWASLLCVVWNVGCRTSTPKPQHTTVTEAQPQDEALEALLVSHRSELVGFEVTATKLARVDGRNPLVAVVAECDPLHTCELESNGFGINYSMVWIYERTPDDRFVPMLAEPLMTGSDVKVMYQAAGPQEPALLRVMSSRVDPCANNSLTWADATPAPAWTLNCFYHRPAQREEITLLSPDNGQLELSSRGAIYEPEGFDRYEVMSAYRSEDRASRVVFMVPRAMFNGSSHVTEVPHLPVSGAIWEDSVTFHGDSLSYARPLSCEEFMSLEPLPQSDDLIAWSHMIGAYGIKPSADQERPCALQAQNARYLEEHLDALMAEYDRRQAQQDIWTSIRWEEMPVELLDARVRASIKDYETRFALEGSPHLVAPWSLGDVLPYVLDVRQPSSRAAVRQDYDATMDLQVLLRAMARHPTRPPRFIEWLHGHIRAAKSLEELGVLMSVVTLPKSYFAFGDVSAQQLALERSAWPIVKDALRVLSGAIMSDVPGWRDRVAPQVWRQDAVFSDIERANLTLQAASVNLIETASKKSSMHDLYKHLNTHPEKLEHVAHTGLYIFLMPFLAQNFEGMSAALREQYIRARLDMDYMFLCNMSDIYGVDVSDPGATALVHGDRMKGLIEEIIEAPSSLEELVQLSRLANQECESRAVFFRMGESTELLSGRALLSAVASWLESHPDDRRDGHRLARLSDVMAQEIKASPEASSEWRPWMLWMLSSLAWSEHSRLEMFPYAMFGTNAFPSWLDTMETVESGGMWVMLHHMATMKKRVSVQPKTLEALDALVKRESLREVELLSSRLRTAGRDEEVDYIVQLLTYMPGEYAPQIEDALRAILQDDALWPERCEVFAQISQGLGTSSRHTDMVTQHKARCEGSP